MTAGGAGDATERVARIGIDIGGTFTDVVYDDGGGDVRYVKTLTTPSDITDGILAGIDAVGAQPSRLRFFLHGTTVALNAFLEGKTPPVALVTTAGFRDVLEIMRTSRPDMYNLQQSKPVPLVRRRWRREISARMAADGSELQPVDPAEVERVVDELVADGASALAVCLLHAYADTAHEQQVRDLVLARHPKLSVTISSDISREWREFERTSTTVINAATRPIMEQYLRRLDERLRARGFDADLLVMQSSNGVMTAEEAIVRPAATLMSGPVGGVAGAERIARRLDGEGDLVTVDIGGTSADVAVIDRGHAQHTPLAQVGDWPVLMPMVDIRSIGAGGGSIASVDPHGALRVGPRSAGADPGPACYGRGGLRATVTDANLVLGRVDGARFLGGAFPLDVAAAHDAIARDVAGPLRVGIEEAAAGVIRVVNSTMSRLLRDVLVERGFDPRRFALLGFGGGGPLHACALAEEAGLARVVVPPHPGTLSAFGIYSADVRRDVQQMFLRRLADTAADALEEAYVELEEMAGAGIDIDPSFARETRRTAELRYSGQEYTITVAVTGGPAVCEQAFHEEHARLYGFSRPSVPVEFVKLAAVHVIRVGGHPSTLPPGRDPTEASPARRRAAHVRGATVDLPVFDRDAVADGAMITGPAAIEEPGATTFVEPGWFACLDPRGNLLLTREGAS